MRKHAYYTPTGAEERTNATSASLKKRMPRQHDEERTKKEHHEEIISNCRVRQMYDAGAAPTTQRQVHLLV